MTENERELMLDLLCDKFVYGLSEEEAKKLEELGYDPREAESIEQTIAALSMADLDTAAEMPAALTQRLQASAAEHFGSASSERKAIESEPTPVPQREIVLSSGGSGGWFGWLGWAAAAVASIALAVSLFVPRGDVQRAGNATPTPTPQQQRTLTPAEQKQQLIQAGGEIVRAEWSKGPWKDAPAVTGDVVWNDAKQEGYMTFRGLPKNDPNRETYQLWIFDETQDEKTPIDGGVFDVSAEGEVIVPIDAKLRTRNPKAFAITIEKPGGVVQSKREKLVTLAPVVKPNQV